MVGALIGLHFNEECWNSRRINKPNVPILFLVDRCAQIQSRGHLMNNLILCIQNIDREGWIFDHIRISLISLVIICCAIWILRKTSLSHFGGRQTGWVSRRVSFSRRFCLFCDHRVVGSETCSLMIAVKCLLVVIGVCTLVGATMLIFFNFWRKIWI